MLRKENLSGPCGEEEFHATPRQTKDGVVVRITHKMEGGKRWASELSRDDAIRLSAQLESAARYDYSEEKTAAQRRDEIDESVLNPDQCNLICSVENDEDEPPWVHLMLVGVGALSDVLGAPLPSKYLALSPADAFSVGSSLLAAAFACGKARSDLGLSFDGHGKEAGGGKLGPIDFPTET